MKNGGKKDDNKDKNDKRKEDEQSDDEDDSDTSDEGRNEAPDEEEKIEPQEVKPRRRERPRRGRNSSYIDRGYESDRGPLDDNYFPPPPVQPIADPISSPLQSSAAPIQPTAYPAFKPYNPADFAGPPTQQERDLANRMENTSIQDYGAHEESHTPNGDERESDRRLPQEDHTYPPAYDPVFPNMPARRNGSTTSPAVDPVFLPRPPKSQNAHVPPSISTTTSPETVPRNSKRAPPSTFTPAYEEDELRERKPSVAEAKYTPNYPAGSFVPSPKLQPQTYARESYPPPDDRFQSPPPAQHQSWATSSGTQPAYPVPMPIPVVPQSQQPMYPVYPPYTAAPPGYSPPYEGDNESYDGHYSRDEHGHHHRVSRASEYSPSRSPPPRHGSKSGRRSREDDRSTRDGRSSSRIKDMFKDRKDVGATALGAIAGGFIGHEVGHGRNVGTLIGAALGGFGANYAERRWEKEKEVRRHRQDEGADGKAQDGYDSY